MLAPKQRQIGGLFKRKKYVKRFRDIERPASQRRGDFTQWLEVLFTTRRADCFARPFPIQLIAKGQAFVERALQHYVPPSGIGVRHQIRKQRVALGCYGF